MNEFNALNTEQRILDLINSTRYEIIQTNGQRIYGPPPNWPENKKPPKNSEVFVGRLPRDCFEDELVPVFAAIGPIYQLRLMVDFSGTNRGFAFVTYINKIDARKAVQLLNRFPIRPNHRIGVVESVDNSRLFIGNLPPNLTQKDVFGLINEITVGVVSAVLYYNTSKRSEAGAENHGFAFIEYESHRDAAMARRKLLPEGNCNLFGSQITIDWAIPEPKGDTRVMSEVTVLFVRYLNYEASEEMIKSIFSFNNQLNVIRVKRIKNYAFIHYSDRNSAELALNRISAMDLKNCPLSEKGGHPLEVKWSIPPDSVNYNKDKLIIGPNNSNTSPNRGLNPIAFPFKPYSTKVLPKSTPFEGWISNPVPNNRLFRAEDFSKFCSNEEKDIYRSLKARKSLLGFQ